MMNSKQVWTRWIFSAAVLGALMGSGAKPAAAQVCYDFEVLAAGTSYVVGDVVTTPDSTITLNSFQWDDGTWTNGGQATVVGSNNASGSPSQELNLNNINLRMFAHMPPNEVRFRYANMGGNVNFAVNGEFVNVANLSVLAGTTVGGCLIDVVFVAGMAGERGRVRITPIAADAVAVVAVGGQEFYVDDFCHQ